MPTDSRHSRSSVPRLFAETHSVVRLHGQVHQLRHGKQTIKTRQRLTLVFLFIPLHVFPYLFDVFFLFKENFTCTLLLLRFFFDDGLVWPVDGWLARTVASRIHHFQWLYEYNPVILSLVAMCGLVIAESVYVFGIQ